MPKFPPVPRLSIIVPIGRDLAAFERTLISVLENQPTDAEVLVTHDGTYEDPYQLCDEVRFVVADSTRLVNQVAAGATQSRGRFVHVVADGISATSGWTEAAMEKFEHFDAAVVAPVIRNTTSNRIIAAGWCDGSDRLCKAACRGSKNVGSSAPKLIGAYLQASFWRREVIRSLSDAFLGGSNLEASYAYEYLIRYAGWRCVLATESDVLCDHRRLPWDTPSLRRGSRLRAIRSHVNYSGWSTSLGSSAVALVENTIRFRLSWIGESIGQALAPLASRQIARQIRLNQVALCEEEGLVCSMPERATDTIRRRAA